MTQILTNISPVAWEHPADRAALNTLRAIPGFDEVVRKVAAFFGERGVRYMFLANAVKVGPRQRPHLHEMWTDVLRTMDWPGHPELYVTQSSEINAGAVGFDRPFVVLNSELLGHLDHDEQRTILGHELGHIMSGHTTYRTIALILMLIGVRNLPFLAGLALLPFELALLEWYRKSELSCDRAGLLAGQDPRASMSAFLKMAGGGVKATSLETGQEDPIDLDEFLTQAREYDADEGLVDGVLKVINVAFRTHPFHTVRAAELQRWVDRGDYDRILRGEYPRRGTERDEPLERDYAAAGDYYGTMAKDTITKVGAQMADVLGRARDAFQGGRGGANGGG